MKCNISSGLIYFHVCRTIDLPFSVTKRINILHITRQEGHLENDETCMRFWALCTNFNKLHMHIELIPIFFHLVHNMQVKNNLHV